MGGPGASWAPLGASRRRPGRLSERLGRVFGASYVEKCDVAGNLQKPMNFSDFQSRGRSKTALRGPKRDPKRPQESSEGVLGGSWAVLGDLEAVLGDLGRIMGDLGAILKPLGAILEPLGAILGRSGASKRGLTTLVAGGLRAQRGLQGDLCEIDRCRRMSEERTPVGSTTRFPCCAGGGGSRTRCVRGPPPPTGFDKTFVEELVPLLRSLTARLGRATS